MATGSITVTLPESVARDIPILAERLLARMHELLERNTNGDLNELEREELESLVEMAQFAELVASAIHQASP